MRRRRRVRISAILADLLSSGIPEFWDPRILGSQTSEDPRMLGSQNSGDPRIRGILGSHEFWNRKILGSQEFWIPDFWDPLKSGIPEVCDLRILGSQKKHVQQLFGYKFNKKLETDAHNPIETHL